MTKIQYLLVCLSEECAEVSQRAAKALRFGLEEVQTGQESTNAERIAQEFQDLLAIIEMLEEEGALERPRSITGIEAKKAKVQQWMEYSINQGTLSR